MRRTFADELHKQMTINDRIYLLTGDLGYKMWDEIRKDYPKRFINCGASEQAMMDMAVGMAYEGIIPVCYSITSFLIYRPFETWITYINHEKLHIIGIGSGRDKDYAHDGISHWSEDVSAVLEPLQNVRQYFPQVKAEIPELLAKVIKEPEPAFISLRR